MNTFFLPCQKCGKRAPLIRGYCADCKPKLHNDHNFMLDTMGQLSDEFEAQTGKSSLRDWYEFENFMASRLAGTEQGERVVQILEN